MNKPFAGSVFSRAVCILCASGQALATLVFSSLLCILPACIPVDGDETDDEETLADTDDSLLAPNALAPNALAPNALAPNALAPNALAPNALAPNALAPNALAPNALAPNALAPNALAPNALAPNALAPNALQAIELPGATGAQNRELLKYVVSCALSATQYFTFVWSDGNGQYHTEVYPGLVGLAPGWATAPLTDEDEQGLVSACLAARVNWYGVAVTVSMRASLSPLDVVSAEELSSHPHIEGAFWGNLFTSTPYLNACHVPANAEIARAAQRDCAVGHLSNQGGVEPCGIIALNGPCSTVCQGFDAGGGHYTSCTNRPGVPGSGTTQAVITTALP